MDSRRDQQQQRKTRKQDKEAVTRAAADKKKRGDAKASSSSRKFTQLLEQKQRPVRSPRRTVSPASSHSSPQRESARQQLQQQQHLQSVLKKINPRPVVKDPAPSSKIVVTKERVKRLVSASASAATGGGGGLVSVTTPFSSSLLSPSAERRDHVVSGNQQEGSSTAKDYIRTSISLPHMNNAAQEFVIDGFALVSFLTKEDLETFITAKEGKGHSDRTSKPQIQHRTHLLQQRLHAGVNRTRMGEEKGEQTPHRSLSSSPEKSSKSKKKAHSPKLDEEASRVSKEDLQEKEKLQQEGSKRRQEMSEDEESDDEDVDSLVEKNKTVASTSDPASTVTDKLDRRTAAAAHTLSLLSSGCLKREFIATTTVTTAVKQEGGTTTTEVDMTATDLADENNSAAVFSTQHDKMTEPGLRATDSAEVKVTKDGINRRTILQNDKDDDGATTTIGHSAQVITGITSDAVLLKREASDDKTLNPSTEERVEISTPTKDVNGLVTVAVDPTLLTNGASTNDNNNNNINTASVLTFPASSSSSVGQQQPPASADHPPPSLAASVGSNEPRHRDKKSSHRDRTDRDRDRENRHRDKDRDRERDKEKEREQREQRDKSTPRPDSRLSASSKADNHNPASQRGFNPVIQSPNPLTQHLFHSSPTPLSPPFPSLPHPGSGGGGGSGGGVGGVGGGGGASSLFSHLNYQQPNWRMFSPAMMGPGAGGMPGMPMSLMGPGFDRAAFFGFPQYSPGGPAFSNGGMGNGMNSAHSLLSSSLPSPFPPSMSGMGGLPLPNFPGLPPNFQSPATPAPTSASSQMSNPSTGPKKPGRWCAMHVRIAWEIYHHQQRQQQQSSASSAEAMKLGDFSKDLSVLAKMGPPISLNLNAPGLTPSFFSRPGAPSDLASSQLPSSVSRLPSQQQPMGWPAMRPPYNFGMPSPGSGLGGLNFPGNPMMGGRDMLASNFQPSSWGQRPMAFGGLANPSPSLNPTNGSSSFSTSTAQSQSTMDRKDAAPPTDKKPALSPLESHQKRPNEEESSSSTTSSSKKKHRSDNHRRSSKSPNTHNNNNNHDKHHSFSKDSRRSPDRARERERDRERERERKRAETPPREGKKSSESASANSAKAIDLRNRIDSVTSAATPNAPERTKSMLPAGASQTTSGMLSGPSPHLPSFPGESPFPSFMASQLSSPSSASFDRNSSGSSMFPSAPGFPPMWPSFDPLRLPVGLGNDPMAAAQIYQWQQRMRGGGGPIMGAGGFSPDMFRSTQFFQQQMERDRLNEMMRFKPGGFSPGPSLGGGPGALFSPQLSSLMRSGGGGLGDPSAMYSPPGFAVDPMTAPPRRSPTPAKSMPPESSGRKDTAGNLLNGKDSPTDLSSSKSRSSAAAAAALGQSQSGKDSASSSASLCTKSSKGQHERSSGSHHSHRHSPPANGETAAASSPAALKVDKDKN